MSQATAERTVLVSHWTPLPQWATGRALLACYATVADRPAVHRVVDAYQDRLADLPQLDLVQRCWLHVTVQGVGFLDGLPPDARHRLAEGLRPRLAALTTPLVRLERAVLGKDSVYLPITPAEPLVALRAAVRTAITETLGVPEPYALPGQRGDYRPHLSVAYANAPVAADVVRDRIADVAPDGPVTEVGTVSVIALHRRDSSWRWSDELRLPIGTGGH